MLVDDRRQGSWCFTQDDDKVNMMLAVMKNQPNLVMMVPGSAR